MIKGVLMNGIARGDVFLTEFFFFQRVTSWVGWVVGQKAGVFLISLFFHILIKW